MRGVVLLLGLVLAVVAVTDAWSWNRNKGSQKGRASVTNNKEGDAELRKNCKMLHKDAGAKTQKSGTGVVASQKLGSQQNQNQQAVVAAVQVTTTRKPRWSWGRKKQRGQEAGAVNGNRRMKTSKTKKQKTGRKGFWG